MIILQDIFDALATGEFSHLKLGNSLQGTIAEEDYPKIVNAINRGLLDLHKKFPLRKGEYTLKQHPNVSKYVLSEEHSGTASEMDDYSYIQLADDEDWPDDFIKVNSLWQTDGTEIPLNDVKHKYLDDNGEAGGFTPSYNVLKMVPWTNPITVLIEYRARHPKIVIDESFDPEEIYLEIPDYIEEALIFYVASLVFRGINSKALEGEVTSASTFATLYRTACLEITNNGLVTTDDDHSQRFEDGGFV